MKRVLVTGANGFIGRACIPHLLARGYEIHAVSRQAVDHSIDVKWHIADLFDAGATAKLVESIRPNYLLHLAWYAVPGKYWTAKENFQWVSASLALLQSFSSLGGQRAVAAGTCAEYDWRYGWCSEEITPTLPSSPYGISKNSLRCLWESMAELSGVSAAWGRVFFLYGPNEPKTRLVSSVVTSLLRGNPAPCTSGEQMRDFLHVSDVAGAFTALLDSDVKGAVNIGSGAVVTVRQVVENIATIIGRPELLRIGDRASTNSEPPLIAADVRCLSNQVKFVPQYDISTGLADTIDWWRRETRLIV